MTRNRSVVLGANDALIIQDVVQKLVSGYTASQIKEAMEKAFNAQNTVTINGMVISCSAKKKGNAFSKEYNDRVLRKALGQYLKMTQ